MKKLLLGFMAIAAMVSCMKEQTVVAPNKMAIGFSDFVSNSSSRSIDPTYNNDTNLLNEFYVWGFMGTNTGVVFNKELVSRSASGWTYANLAYWAPSKTYKFAALAPVASIDNGDIVLTLAQDDKYMSTEGHLGTVAFTNQNGTVDLLYATDEVTTPNVIPDSPEKVEFMFKHLLSKVKFTFTNGLSNELTTMVISDVKMVAPANGTIDLATSAWTVTGAATSTLEFGKVVDKSNATNSQLAVAGVGEVENERLVIPAASYDVSFTVTLYNGTEAWEPVEMTSTIANVTLTPGKCYNFTATLNATNLRLKAIEFDDPIVEDWVNAGDHDLFN